ncbi:hypothetical protein RDABS01_014017 [Bienertia sinuspersici]
MIQLGCILILCQKILHANPHDTIDVSQEYQANKEYREAASLYYSWLQQKVKIHWLQGGDSNSKIFYNSLRTRASKNTVNRHIINQGQWVEDMNSITMAFTHFYEKLMQGNENKTPLVNDIINLGSRLTEQHKLMQDYNFTDKEIKQAMFSIPSNKAPGLDGFNSHFYKAAWHIMGGDVIKAVRDFFATGKLLKEGSVITLTMIPTVKTPSTVGEFRPIACCSIIYKCISKLLFSRLSLVLLHIISSNQGAFVSGRSIMHNALICQDMMRFYRPCQI